MALEMLKYILDLALNPLGRAPSAGECVLEFAHQLGGGFIMFHTFMFRSLLEMFKHRDA